VEVRFEPDLGHVAQTSNEQMEAQPEIPRHKDPDVVEAHLGFGVRQAMFSCAKYEKLRLNTKKID
jgi:hypothetical protein